MYKMHARMQTHTGIPERIEMIKLRKAHINEANEILSFYEDIIFSIRDSEFNPKWNAQRAFEKWGFEYVDSVEMFHEAVGWETFHLFERILNE